MSSQKLLLGLTSGDAATRRSFWALGDQGTVSLGNFLTQIVLARQLTRSDYGVFALIFGVMLLLNYCHTALIGYPLSLKGAVADAARLKKLTASSLWLSVMLFVFCGVALLAACLILKREDLFVWCVAALLCWQLQETLRRALMAHARYDDALWGDALSYVGQACLVAWIASRGILTLPVAFAVIALTSAVAGVLQLIQVGTAVTSIREIHEFGADCWLLGRWAVITNAANASTHVSFPWMLAFMKGPQEAAPFQALWNIMGVTHPVFQGMHNLILPCTAQAHHRDGFRAALHSAARYAALGALFILPYLAVLSLLPHLALTTFYGAAYAFLNLENAVRLFALGYAFDYICTVVTALLNGVERPTLPLLAQTTGAAAAIALGVPLVRSWGVQGACAGYLCMAICRAAVAVCLLHRFERNQATKPECATSSASALGSI